jgi:hypothetical protein
MSEGDFIKFSVQFIKDHFYGVVMFEDTETMQGFSRWKLKGCPTLTTSSFLIPRKASPPLPLPENQGGECGVDSSPSPLNGEGFRVGTVNVNFKISFRTSL